MTHAILFYNQVYFHDVTSRVDCIKHSTVFIDFGGCLVCLSFNIFETKRVIKT